ncbi:MAG: dioxygenase [Sphingobium sp. 32-64-5]|nr:MAG: dioxygenase [Sphingobium sp. 32-64-5]
MKQPVLYIPHGGGPCFFLNPDGSCPPMWMAMRDYLAQILPSLPERPRAILIVSAHWIEPRFSVLTTENPGLYFDYYGFPPHTYDLRWDAPNSLPLAHRAAALLQQAGFDTGEETERGWDHGVFVPMKVALPDADIPVAQLSLLAPHGGEDFDAAAHIRAGEALAPLRDEGVLIIGSGMSFHNLRLRDGSVAAHAEEFDDALSATVCDPDATRRNAGLERWAELPQARTAHPPRGEEHLIPLMVAAGAAQDDPGQHAFRDQVIGWTVSAYRFG